MAPFVRCDPSNELDVVALLTTLPTSLGDLPSAQAVRELLSVSAVAPMAADDEVRRAVRDLLREGGFKPSGRSKPASEYLLRAARDGFVGPEQSINALVDVCNATSLHSGIPVSVVDADLALPPWRLAVAPPGTRYLFNASGQELDLGGLWSLSDAAGPCAGPVKDSQRTKTHAGTRTALWILWGSRALPGRTQALARWISELLSAAGVQVEPVPVSSAD